MTLGLLLKKRRMVMISILYDYNEILGFFFIFNGQKRTSFIRGHLFGLQCQASYSIATFEEICCLRLYKE